MISSLARTCRQFYCPLNQISKPFVSELTSRKISLPKKQLTSSISFFKRTEPQDDRKDSIQIYREELDGNVFRVKAFSLLSSGFGLAYLPIAIHKIMNEDISVVAIVISGTIFSFFTFITPLLLHQLAKRYVTAVSYSEDTDTYAAKTYSFFLRDKELTFKANEVDVPETPPFLASFVVRGNPLFVDPKSFTDLNHYKRFMKYDVPLDLKLTSDIKEKSKIN
ncbi:hypothetical protein LSTR_LSTR001871 [Laodelphax striatellus]|uniref:Transmembrane protein 70 homolog, mitochondrial n=1 Tax=Laodelphax striatellus TaxID=195883 RepID=A0A482WFZ4_LAOST|nr:hypothetical protein LSTR_LSTR001871 [Laodelphax striatellus]